MSESFTLKDWFKTVQLDAQTWAIDDHGEDICYLACGTSSCLLIDTGWGIGDLKSLVSRLCSLPLQVMNTHGHPDHVFGNWQFPEVFITEEDMALIGNPPSLAMRRYIVEDIITPPLPEDFDVEKWNVGLTATLTPIREGQIFDLGDRVLEVIALPGHSPGSLALLDVQRRWLFSGDTLLSWPIWLQLTESLPLSGFLASLNRLQKRAGEFDTLYAAHGELETLPLPASLLEDMIKGIGSILDGTLKGVPETTFAGDGLRADFGTCGVIYNPDRL